MRRYLPLNLHFLLLLALFRAGFAEAVLQWQENTETLEIGSQIQYIVDQSNQLTIDEIRHNQTLEWQRTQLRTPSFGFSDATYWVRFTITNNAETTQDVFLDVSYALLDEVTLYQFSHPAQSTAVTMENGDNLPFKDRLVEHRKLLFPLTLTGSTTFDIYLRIRSTSSIQIPMQLWAKSTFYSHDQYSIFGHGVYYGIVLVMALYNLFLYLRLGDRTYLLYVIYIAAFAITQMALTGFAYQFFWPDSPQWNQSSIAVLTPIIVVFGCLFISYALKLRLFYPRIHLYFLVLINFNFFCFLAALFLSYNTLIKLVALMVIVACSSALYSSYHVWLTSRQRYAALFSIAWTVFLFGVVCLALNKFGWIPRNFFTESAAQIGSAIEIMLLSYALAERLQDANRQRLDAEHDALVANEQLLAEQQKHSAQLESTVQQRTQELTQALHKVQQLNNELIEISATDPLTGLKNRRRMDEILAIELSRSRRDKTPLSVILLDLDHFKRINDQYGHPFGDKVLKQVSQIIINNIRRPPDEACRYGGEELVIILPQTPLSGAHIVAEKIRKHIAATEMQTADEKLHVTASLGVACSDPKSGSYNGPAQLLEKADIALYEAKSEGRNCTVLNSFRNI
ncbi:MAG: diguanylate cyclase [Pseudomonadales bacterium]|uniref:diguanylate cyclase n=1 Tax=Oleiphilus messinensis TaxID=141451 RepID=A0A1Y0I400_9GAMM|nr:diguanylate cyclase [Oleiphilus messinensis]ARU54516.1 7TM domain sensor-containing signal transduction diguanylate cyclase [Oleiphilus messinensis]MCG8612169.1 diguanylate cyclase [Pseudomonadales bacterium]